MVRRKLEKSQIKIPEPLIDEVDKMVIETGLYSDKREFVADACRRLIIASNMKEVNSKLYENEVQVESEIKIGDINKKRSLNRSFLKGDI
jgi:metal-responsive CopG/Arc/MetJ family transcriptional regulator